MSRSLMIKVLVTTALALALMIPLGAIRSIVRERMALRDGVVDNIQRSSVTTQKLVGPFLVIPYRRTFLQTITDSHGKNTTTTRHEDGQLRFLPDELTVTASAETEHRYRGIYAALLYQSRHALTGAFSVPADFGVVDTQAPNVSYTWGTAFVALGVSDPRGIKGKLMVRWDAGQSSTSREFNGGTSMPIGTGVHAQIGPLPSAGGAYRFAIDLQLAGAQSWEVVPVGKETTVKMKSPWPHPSFIGQFLPESRSVGATGFEAVWRTSRLASNIEAALAACDDRCAQLLATTLGVAFVNPVDVYLQTERSAKYGFLFIAITFIVFSLYELLKRLAIHPVQYGLVGMALAMFFLLLVALSEHLPFVLAYVIASACSLGLLGFYVSFVLRSVRRGAAFAGLLTMLYGALYVLLQSEDMALLLGAVLLFGILAVIMIVTRRVDWYRLTARAAERSV